MALAALLGLVAVLTLAYALGWVLDRYRRHGGAGTTTSAPTSGDGSADGFAPPDAGLSAHHAAIRRGIAAHEADCADCAFDARWDSST